jgi:ADP-heptose:LPS heptosyltransferase
MFHKEEIKKILCIKPRGIGDILLSTIVLENLHNVFPDSEIHYLTEEFAKRAVENNPFVSKILTFHKRDFIFSILRKVRREKYDIVFDFWSNPKTAQITFLSGAKYRVGFEKRGRNYAYNFRGLNGTMGNHAAEDNLVLLKVCDIPVTSKNIIYQTSEKEKKVANNFFNSINYNTELNLIGIIPSGGWESKRCDPIKWIEICNEIKIKYKSAFLILWGPGDEKDAKSIFNGLNSQAFMIPESTFGELSAYIEKCDLIIANDSGPMHVSAALGIPTLGIFGPTNPEAHGPYSDNSAFVFHSELHCINCNKLECPYNHECMIDLPIEKVINQVSKLLVN